MVFQGYNQFIPPIRSDVPLPDENGNMIDGYPTMFVVVPVKDTDGSVIAALSIRLNPFDNFTKMTQTAQIGNSGETYIINKDGKLLTETRFLDDLHSVGLLKNEKYSILNIEIRDPGENLLKGIRSDKIWKEQPLTYAVEQVLKNKSGFSKIAYRDYRGINTLGAWLWDEDLNLGFIAEIDEAEAIEPYITTRYLTIGLLLIAILLMLVISYINWKAQLKNNKIIEEKERYFRTLLNNAADGLIIINEKGVIEIFNLTAENIFGYTADEIIGKKLEILIPERYKKNHPEHRNMFFSHPESKAMGAGRYLYALRKDGVEFPAEIGLNPIETEKGTLTLASIVDITERKKHEEALKISAEKIKDKNKELELSEQKLKELNIAKDRLFSIIGHDLRGPIGGFKQLIDYLVSDFDLNETELLSELLESVQGSASTTYDLLENLLIWAKTQQNEITFSPVNCNLNEIAEKSILLHQEIANKKKINIINNIPKNLTVFADVNMVNTVIRNLISNAIKFTNSDKSIYISANKNENDILISIKDEGIGIGPENIEKIFDHNENFTTFGTGNEKGSGLGLMLCQEFIKKHGGKIWIESELGKGSDFKFTLPFG